MRRWAAGAVAMVCWWGLVVPGAAADESSDPCAPGTGWRCGYIDVPQRLDARAVKLSYNLRLPFTQAPSQDQTPLPDEVDRPLAKPGEITEPPGPFPTALVYSGYNVSYRDSAGPIGKALVRAGWAVLLVNVRGTGCSGGAYQPFGLTEALDAKHVIDDWVQDQPWSSGEVAMIGVSYAAITQLPAAAQRPKHLRAIVPVSPAVDLYRDVTHPGGIPNVGVTAYATATQNAFSGSFAAFEAKWEVDKGRDPVCTQHLSERAQEPQHAPAAQWAQHPTYDEFWRERSPDVEQIEIPILLFTAFQDTVVGSRAVESLANAKKLNAILFNGGHGEKDYDGNSLEGMASSVEAVEEAVAFLEHHVRGVANGYDEKPRIRVWWESGRNATLTPGWTTSHQRWPVPKSDVTRLHLGGNGTTGGVLTSSPVLTPGTSSYVAASGSGQTHLTSRWRGGPAAGTWVLPPEPGAAVTYTTEPLAQDLAALGTASLDLWLSSTADDTDVQVTLSEVRDDGSTTAQEVFVQQGWLRASHRALDETRSRETAPYHLHTTKQPLERGKPTWLRVEILPFAHLFRAGSRLRVTVEAPKSVGDEWGFTPSAPAANTVHQGGQHPSQLVLATLPAELMDAPLSFPDCGSVYGQPCRPVLK